MRKTKVNLLKITIGADHRGYNLKEKIKRYLKAKGFLVRDAGTFSKEPCDYPKIAFKVGRDVASSQNRKGILVCKTGIGDCIAANKVRGIRAALCYNMKAARLSRKHNDSNILVLGADFIKEKSAKEIIEVWLKTEFEAGRHLRRINQIKDFEQKK